MPEPSTPPARSATAKQRAAARWEVRLLAVASMAAGIGCVHLARPVVTGEGFLIHRLQLQLVALLAVFLGAATLFASRLERRRGGTSGGLRSLGVCGALTAVIAAAAPRVFNLPLREAGGRQRCPSNLSHIGLITHWYADAHGGRLPDDVNGLFASGYLSPADFVCPSSGDTPAATAARIQSPGHCSYIYLGKGRTQKEATANFVLAYESLTNHRGEGMNVLYGTGDVEWLDAGEARAVLAELATGHNPPRQDEMAELMAAEVRTRHLRPRDR